jgi:hypothetical protein
VPLDAAPERTRQTRVVKRRLTELSQRVEQIGLLPGIEPFSRELERADDDSRVRGRIAAEIDGSETTRTEVGTNVKRTETVGPMLGR